MDNWTGFQHLVHANNNENIKILHYKEAHLPQKGQ